MKTELKISFIILIAIGFGLLLVFLTTCKKDCCNDPVTPPVPIALTTDTVTDITQTTAKSGGTITSDGGDTITARGVCWSTAQSPTIADSLTSDSIGIGNFTSSITGLSASTTYYVRAYAINRVDTAYGNQRTFTTLAATALPVLTTDPVTNITQTTATCGGVITSGKRASVVTERGVCWSTSPNPTTANSKTSDGSGTGAFVSNMTGLNANTTYFVRAYATNNVGTGYGNEQTFSTLPPINLPTLTTTSITNITQTTAVSGGNITTDGGSPVTERGVCWSTSPNPTTANNKTSDGSGIGTFVSNLTGLTANTTYYVRAYATNTIGTGYGNEEVLTTLPNITLPTLTTTNPSNFTQITFTCGGDVTSDGGDPVTARGVCWSTSSNPTVNDPHTSDGTGTGIFISQVTNLLPNTSYYIRAYATNSVGTAYGNEFGCATVPNAFYCPEVPTITYGGQVYNTVMIGSQCWMRENLNIGTEIPGSLDQTDNGIMEKYCYDDLASNCDVYGGLYQWGEMVQYLNGASNTTTWNPPPTGNVQGICPPGWHIPTYDEYDILADYLGGTSLAGGKMKETGFTHWLAPNTDATNESGFTALPGGSRNNNGFFGGLGTVAWFWTSTTPHPQSAWIRTLHFANGVLDDGNQDKAEGESIRCLKD
ncbi:MAG: hypothetical protein ISS17_10080 [Bacteroidales bacterium]|nr:hypothetical protein [Bacteroidales bacterium]